MFQEDTAVFLADFGVPASFTPAAGSWTFDGIAPTFDSITYTFDGAQSYSAKVIFDAVDKEILSGRAISAEYRIVFRTLDLPGLVFQSEITVNGQLYTLVEPPMRIEDGVFSEALLEI
jgi:hypothetical protein